METRACGVLIAGGGPAGLSTWLHLHALAPDLAAGAVLIEKESYPREKLCGGGVTPLADKILLGLGIRTQCVEVPIHHIEFRFGGERIQFDKSHAFRVVRRRELDREIAEAAIARGLELHQGEELLAIEPRDGGLGVETSRGRYQTQVLVGADGVYSAVRQNLGLAGGTRLARVIEILTPPGEGLGRELAPHTAVFDFSPVTEGLQGYVWHFPCVENGRPAVSRGICDTRLRAQQGRADLRGLFARELERFGIERQATTWEGHPVRCFSPRDTLSRAHAFLVGDAAGIDPTPGEGIAQSLDYGDLAAQAIIDAFHRGDFTFADYRNRLLRHPLGRALLTRTRLARRLYGAPDLERMKALWLRSLPAA